MKFHLKRRQQFLSEAYYAFYSGEMAESTGFWKENLPANAGSEAAGRVLAYALAARTGADLFLLRYTAGESPDVLRNDLTGVIDLYEQSTSYARAEAQSEATPPLLLDEPEDYQRLLQLIGLAILLHRTDLLPRIASMFDGAYAGDDALYEDLLSFYLEERFDVDDLLHKKPYRHLFDAIRRESEQSIDDISKYLKAWYPAMSKLTWHDSHLDLTENGPGYYGYWAIEAGTVAYLLELDDRLLRPSIVYPADLVDFARSCDKRGVQATAVDESVRLRVAGEQ